MHANDELSRRFRRSNVPKLQLHEETVVNGRTRSQMRLFIHFFRHNWPYEGVI